MTDRFKFRAWDEDRNKMIGSDYPDNWGDDMDEWYADVSRMELTGIEYISKGMPVMQYTGLKDKNGKEIYEGDIVKRKRINKHAGGEGKFIVKWWAERTCFALHDGKEWQTDYHDHAYRLVSKNVEIIGNVYEHPHLIKQDE